jgi:hypothetical protein
MSDFMMWGVLSPEAIPLPKDLKWTTRNDEAVPNITPFTSESMYTASWGGFPAKSELRYPIYAMKSLKSDFTDVQSYIKILCERLSNQLGKHSDVQMQLADLSQYCSQNNRYTFKPANK